MARIPFDAEAIRALADILVETGLTEIEIAEKDSRIRVVRSAVPILASTGLGSQVLGSAVAVAAAPVAPVAPADDSRHPGAVLSPMVGVAYLASEPGVAPFVTVGQAVSAGQTLLLIEAMKTFNQIKAPVAGRIARIVVGAGAPVEYGEVLMVIEP